MEFAVGAILEGKVTGITKFGAFVALPGGKSGLVHISNISDSYVSDINEFLTVGQEVKVKVLNIDQNDRINLSIKHVQSSSSPRLPRSGGRSSAPQERRERKERDERGSPKWLPQRQPRHQGQKRQSPQRLQRAADL